MTEGETRDLGKKIDRLSEAVHGGQLKVAEQLGRLSAKVEGLGENYGHLSEAVEKVAKEQASCPARGGVKGVNARLRRLEDRADPSPGGQPRGDDSGLVDLAVERARAEAERAARVPFGVAALGVLRPILPWIVAALVGLGVYLGSGGDSEATSRAIRDFTERLIQIEKTVKPTGSGSASADEDRDDVTAWGPTSDPAHTLSPLRVLP